MERNTRTPRTIGLALLLASACVSWQAYRPRSPEVAPSFEHVGPATDQVVGPTPTPDPTTNAAPIQELLPQDVRRTILQQIDERRYAVEEVPEGLVADNPAQDMVVHFSDKGFELFPLEKAADRDEPAWRFALGTPDLGRAGFMHPMPQVAPRADGQRITYDADSMQAWYENGVRGVEQGFEVVSPPSPEADGPLVLSFAVETELQGSTDENGRHVTFRDEEGDLCLLVTELFVTDAAGRSFPATLAYEDMQLAFLIDDTEARYPLTIDPLYTRWLGKLTASDGGPGDRFGSALSLSGETLAVGAYGHDGGDQDEGAVYLYRLLPDGRWGDEQKLTASDAEGGDDFGYSVSLCGARLVVGAPRDDDEGLTAGAVYVFERQADGTWTEQMKITASDAAAHSAFGVSVSLAEDRFAVGAPWGPPGSGRRGTVYVFTRDHRGRWLEDRIESTDGNPGLNYSLSVGLLGDVLAVGAPEESAAEGSVYVYRYDAQAGWGNERKIVKGNLSQFGAEVAVSEHLLVVGGGTTWSAYLFDLAAPWPWDGVYFGGSGWSVALSGRRIAAGHPNERASVHFRGPDGWVHAYERFVTPYGGEDGDDFGHAVALSDHRLAVGAPEDDDHGDASGSVQVFEQHDETWVHTAVARPGEVTGFTLEEFGLAVARDGDTLVVGAPGSDDQGVQDAGAAFVFLRGFDGADRWGLRSRVEPARIYPGERFGAAVAVRGAYVLVGAPGYDGGRGRAVFLKPDTFGYEELMVTEGEPGERLGESTAALPHEFFVGGPGLDRFHVHEVHQGGLEKWGRSALVQGPTNGAFAASLAADQTSLVVGAPGSRFAYIYGRDDQGPSSWAQIGVLAKLGLAPGFGKAVALSGTTALVGDPGANGGDGAIHWFERNFGGPGTWGRVTKVLPPSPGQAAGFGSAVDVAGDLVAAGEPLNDEVGPNAGAAYLYDLQRQPGPAFDMRAALFPTSDQAAGVQFGLCLSMDPLDLSVGLPFAGGGEAYTYRRQDTLWEKSATVNAGIPVNEEAFGFAATIFGDTAAIGAPGYDHRDGVNLTHDVGAVYLFERHQGGPENWGQTARIIGPDGDPGDRFGHAVSLYGDTLAVGVPYHSRRIGIPGQMINVGKVRIFERNQGGSNAWGSVRSLLSPDLEDDENFGWDVDVDGDMLAVGVEVSDPGECELAIFTRFLSSSHNWDHLETVTSPCRTVDIQGTRMVAGDENGFAWFSLAAPAGGNPVSWSGHGGDIRNTSSVAIHGSIIARGIQEGGTWTFRAYSLGGTAYGVDYEWSTWPGSPVVVAAGPGYVVGAHSSFSGTGHNLDIVSFPDDWRLPKLSTRIYFSPQILSVAADDTTILLGLENGTAEIVELATPWDLYLRRTFSDAVLNNPDLEHISWGDGADPDGDRLGNVGEAYGGLDPLVKDGKILQGHGFDHLAGEFVVRWRESTANPGVKAAVQWSPDMYYWLGNGDGKLIHVSEVGEVPGSGYRIWEARMRAEPHAWGGLRLVFWRE